MKDRLEGQVAYFEKKKQEAEKETALLQRFLTLATAMAPWVAGLALFYKVVEKAGVDLVGPVASLGLASLPCAEFLRFLPIALPLAASYLGSRQQASDAARRRIRYAELAKQLRAISAEIGRLKSGTSTARAVREAEEVLLGEQLEWRLREAQAARR